MAKKTGKIYVGIGGWTFAPWRGVFYPEKLPQAKELEYAANHLTSIEINGTYYGSQKPESFRKWAREVPDGFIFSVKGPRFATNRRVLAIALPIVLSNATIPLLGAVDTGVVGQLGRAEPIGAVGIGAGPVTYARVIMPTAATGRVQANLWLS